MKLRIKKNAFLIAFIIHLTGLISCDYKPTYPQKKKQEPSVMQDAHTHQTHADTQDSIKKQNNSDKDIKDTKDTKDTTQPSNASQDEKKKPTVLQSIHQGVKNILKNPTAQKAALLAAATAATGLAAYQFSKPVEENTLPQPPSTPPTPQTNTEIPSSQPYPEPTVTAHASPSKAAPIAQEALSSILEVSIPEATQKHFNKMPDGSFTCENKISECLNVLGIEDLKFWTKETNHNEAVATEITLTFEIKKEPYHGSIGGMTVDRYFKNYILKPDLANKLRRHKGHKMRITFTLPKDHPVVSKIGDLSITPHPTQTHSISLDPLSSLGISIAVLNFKVEFQENDAWSPSPHFSSIQTKHIISLLNLIDKKHSITLRRLENGELKVLFNPKSLDLQTLITQNDALTPPLHLYARHPNFEDTIKKTGKTCSENKYPLIVSGVIFVLLDYTISSLHLSTLIFIIANKAYALLSIPLTLYGALPWKNPDSNYLSQVSMLKALPLCGYIAILYFVWNQNLILLTMALTAPLQHINSPDIADHTSFWNKYRACWAESFSNTVHLGRQLVYSTVTWPAWLSLEKIFGTIPLYISRDGKTLTIIVEGIHIDLKLEQTSDTTELTVTPENLIAIYELLDKTLDIKSFKIPEDDQDKEGSLGEITLREAFAEYDKALNIVTLKKLHFMPYPDSKIENILPACYFNIVITTNRTQNNTLEIKDMSIEFDQKSTIAKNTQSILNRLLKPYLIGKLLKETHADTIHDAILQLAKKGLSLIAPEENSELAKTFKNMTIILVPQ